MVSFSWVKFDGQPNNACLSTMLCSVSITLQCIALHCNFAIPHHTIIRFYSLCSLPQLFHWWNLVFIEKSSCRNCLPQGTMYCTKFFVTQ